MWLLAYLSDNLRIIQNKIRYLSTWREKFYPAEPLADMKIRRGGIQGTWTSCFVKGFVLKAVPIAPVVNILRHVA